MTQQYIRLSVTVFLVTWQLLCSTRSSAERQYFRRADNRRGILARGTRNVEAPMSTVDEINKNEDTVINTILRVVDHKFDTLSARLTALERAVNGLQYYSVRQFRLLYTNSKSINSQIQDISTRVSGLEIEISRADLSGVRGKVESIDHDVKMLFRQNNDMFEGMEQTLVVVNDNVNKGALELKSLLEKQIATITLPNPDSNSTTDDSEETEIRVVNDEMVESKESDNDKNVPDTIDSSPQQTDIDTFTVAKYFHKLENMVENYFNVSALREAEQQTTTTPMPPPPPSIPVDTVMKLAKDATNNITTILTSLQGKMADSVKFQRHAEHMLERLITNGESLSEQTIVMSDTIALLDQRIRDLEEQSSKSRVRVEELQSHSLLEAKRLAEKYVKTGQLSEECKIPPSLRTQIGAIVAKNASHVFDRLTELSQMSTTSLPTTVLDLHEAISKLEKMATEYNALIAAEKADDFRKRALDENETRRQIEETLNHTRASFNIIEAVSSNTGWLPLLLDTIDVIGITANSTLAVVNNVYEKVKEPLKIVVQSKTSLTTRHYDHVKPPSGGAGTTEINIYDGQLQDLYTSMRKYERLLPAISNMLSKSGLLFGIVNGSTPYEGRVEMFNDGVWGTVCSIDFADHHADTMCRTLGFSGGHVSPAGRFGSGTGPVWDLNPSCVKRKQRLKSDSSCVRNSRQTGSCSHAQDLGIVCDYLVRLKSAITNMRRGTVEVYLHGTWGGICYDGWDDVDATVACKQLGYRSGQSVDAGQVHLEKPVWLKNVSCTGKERRLDQCRHTGWEWKTCYSNRLAGVQCGY